MKIKEMRKLSPEDSEKKLNELKLELLKERGNVEMGETLKTLER